MYQDNRKLYLVISKAGEARLAMLTNQQVSDARRREAKCKHI